MQFNFDTMMGAVGVWVAAMSALALGVERVMDLLKTFATKHLVAERLKKNMTEEEKDEHYKKENKRQRRVRIWAIVFGLILAFICKIDTFDILGIPSPFWFGFPVLGCIISGLAASRGSAFWHDAIEAIRGIRSEKTKIIDARMRGEEPETT